MRMSIDKTGKNILTVEIDGFCISRCVDRPVITKRGNSIIDNQNILKHLHHIHGFGGVRGHRDEIRALQ